MAFLLAVCDKLKCRVPSAQTDRGDEATRPENTFLRGWDSPAAFNFPFDPSWLRGDLVRRDQCLGFPRQEASRAQHGIISRMLRKETTFHVQPICISRFFSLKRRSIASWD
jgi:hypothetical protein